MGVSICRWCRYFYERSRGVGYRRENEMGLLWTVLCRLLLRVVKFSSLDEEQLLVLICHFC